MAIWSLNTYKYCYIGKMGKSKPTNSLKTSQGEGYLDKWKLRWRCDQGLGLLKDWKFFEAGLKQDCGLIYNSKD